MHQPFGGDQIEQLRILLIEDNPADARLVRRLLSETQGAMTVRWGLFEVTQVDLLSLALELLTQESFDAVLLDLHLPDSLGLETLAKVRTAASHAALVVLTGNDDDGLALSAIQRGAQDYVPKDQIEGRVLVRTLRHAIERKRAEAQLLRHAREVESAHARIEQQAAELRARADELDRINRELDDFTYIASHDLKEPLRGIAAYSEIVLEDYRDKLDADGRRRLETMVHLCRRLENLIGDLLTYCRVGGARPADTGIDLGEVLKDVLETLHPTIDRRNALVQVVDRLPKVTGDATLVGMALGNLISNGLKFNESVQPRIEIGCLPTSPPTFFVRDNGIGIEKKHHETIFTIFRRLHSHQKYEGSGAGLTIVRKIVEAHGGRVWLDSKPGAGTTFFFTLASAVPAPATPKAPHWNQPARKSQEASSA